MTRARFYDVSTDPAGRPVLGVTVNVYTTGTTTPLPATLYAAATGGATRANPFVTTTGVVDFWLEDPAVVDIKYTLTGYGTQTQTVEVVEATPPATAVSVTPVGNLVSTTAQAAFAELDGDLTAEAAARAAADALLIPLTQKGATNGVATLDGSATVPDAQIPASIARDAETSAAVATETTNRTAADAAHAASLVAHSGTYVAIEKLDNGGVFLPPLRVPTLVVKEMYPNRTEDFKIAWVEDDGDTIYAVGWDKQVRKSLDAGVTWTNQGYANSTLLAQGTFLKLASGTLLTAKSGAPEPIARSTDDGATWTTVLTMRTSALLMASQSWCEDLTTGYVYLAEYQSVDTFTDILIYRSTDDGATFTTFATLPGPAGVDPNKIRHVHSCQYDPVSARVYFLVGDNDVSAGIYRVNGAGTGVEAVILNSQMTTQGWGTDCARAIGMLWFPDYIAWTSDSTANPYLFRMARSEIGDAVPTVERIYRLNSTGWFSVRAADDGTRWVVACAPTALPLSLDSAVHLYAVEDQGATIYEIGAIASDRVAPDNASLSPVGQAEIHGDLFWLQTYGYTSFAYYKCQLARGTTPMPLAPKRPLVYAWERVNCPPVIIGAGDEIVFGYSIGASTTNKVFVFDYGVEKIAGSATLKVRLRRRSDLSIVAGVDSTVTRKRQNGHDEAASHVASDTVASTEVLEAVLVNTGGSDVTAAGFVTFGWGA